MTTPLKAVGRIWLNGKTWHVVAQHHVVMVLKRLFPRFANKSGEFQLADTPENAADLVWFTSRYVMDVRPLERLQQQNARYIASQVELQRIEAPDYVPTARALALPLRKYQAVAVDLFLGKRALLLGDTMGLGKSATSIGAMASADTMPALVVTYAHLQTQWAREVTRFLPGAKVHVIKQRDHYRPKTGTPDVWITTYSKLAAWAQYLSGVCRLVVYDEIQELRCTGTDKYNAALHLSKIVPYRIGLSGTPVYNMGGEIWAIMETLSPGCLGQRDEFNAEWCCGGTGENAGKWVVKNPQALGSYLRSEHLLLRRTREEVGREIPAVSRYTQEVDANEGELDAVAGSAGELARLILDSSKRGRGQDMQTASEFVNLLRQQTGIAKAPAVAAFVKMMLEQGEPVILAGWHHRVYDLWRVLLKDHNPVFYTGTESEKQKTDARDKFVSGKTNLLVISVRSGVGLDGLQERCRTVVIGELDWSPGPMKQLIARVHRDGQTMPVFAYFTFCNSGSDPIMMETLGLKDSQARGINDPWATGAEIVDNGAEQRVRRLAEDYLQRNRV